MRPAVLRSWKLWAVHQTSGYWHIGDKPWVELHEIKPVVPVLVEELDVDPLDPTITNYGWETFDPKYRDRRGYPEMMQIRTGDGRDKPAWMFLDMCFTYGIKIEIKQKTGRMLALRVTERTEDG